MATIRKALLLALVVSTGTFAAAQPSGEYQDNPELLKAISRSAGTVFGIASSCKFSAKEMAPLNKQLAELKASLTKDQVGLHEAAYFVGQQDGATMGKQLSPAECAEARNHLGEARKAFKEAVAELKQTSGK